MEVARKAARPGLERKHPAVGATEAGTEEAAGGPHRVAEARARARRVLQGRVGSSG